MQTDGSINWATWRARARKKVIVSYDNGLSTSTVLSYWEYAAHAESDHDVTKPRRTANNGYLDRSRPNDPHHPFAQSHCCSVAGNLANRLQPRPGRCAAACACRAWLASRGIVPEPGLLIVPAGQCQCDGPGGPRRRADFVVASDLLGLPRLEGQLCASGLHQAAI